MWHLVWYYFGFWLLDWFFVWFLFQIILIMNKVQRMVNNQAEIRLIVKVHSLRKINDVPFYQFYSFWNVWILSKRFLNLTLEKLMHKKLCFTQSKTLLGIKQTRFHVLEWVLFILFWFILSKLQIRTFQAWWEMWIDAQTQDRHLNQKTDQSNEGTDF